MVTLHRLLLIAIVALAMLGFLGPARADEFGDAVAGLGADGFAEKGQAIVTLGKLGDPRAIPVLQALSDDRLRKAPDGHVIIVSDLTAIEMFSLLARKQRENRLSPADLLTAQVDFLTHVEREYLSVALDSPLLIQARALVNLHPLRALDAVQLAAWRANTLLQTPLTFVSGDNNLLSVARAEGFAIGHIFDTSRYANHAARGFQPGNGFKRAVSRKSMISTRSRSRMGAILKRLPP